MESSIPNSVFSKVKTIVEKVRSNTSSTPVPRQIYAVGTGTYVGELLVFIKKHGEDYLFLSVPKNRNRKVPIEKFDFAIKHKIIEFVEELPAPIYKLCVAQFEYNEKHKDSGNSIKDEHK